MPTDHIQLARESYGAYESGDRSLLDALLSDAADLILTHDLRHHPDVMVQVAVKQPFCALVVRVSSRPIRCAISTQHETPRTITSPGPHVLI